MSSGPVKIVCQLAGAAICKGISELRPSYEQAGLPLSSLLDGGATFFTLLALGQLWITINNREDQSLASIVSAGAAGGFTAGYLYTSQNGSISPPASYGVIATVINTILDKGSSICGSDAKFLAVLGLISAALFVGCTLHDGKAGIEPSRNNNAFLDYDGTIRQISPKR